MVLFRKTHQQITLKRKADFDRSGITPQKKKRKILDLSPLKSAESDPEIKKDSKDSDSDSDANTDDGEEVFVDDGYVPQSQDWLKAFSFDDSDDEDDS